MGGGSFAYFTELNRKRRPFVLLDFVCHTTCAIVHAADDRSVTETIECLPYVIRSGRFLFRSDRPRHDRHPDKPLRRQPTAQSGQRASRLVHTAADTPQPWYDESGGVYPSYHVVRALYAASGATRRATEISTPRDVQALAFETSDGIELWLANLLPEPRVVGVEGVDLSRGRVEMSCR